MWILIFAIICEFIVGAYSTYWLYKYTACNKIIVSICALLTIAICLGTWSNLI